MKRWRDWLNTERQEDGKRAILDIRDPLAIDALKMYAEKDEAESVRILMVEALYKTGALRVLAERSLDDPSEEVRLTCLDDLDDAPHPELVAFYIQKLRDKDNVIVNRAAVGLARLKDPSAITPLVDALVTTHTFKIETGVPAGSTTSTFGSQGTGFSTGGGGPRIVKQEMHNPSVLDALVVLAGDVNFNYDVASWKKWLASQRKSKTIDARRG